MLEKERGRRGRNHTLGNRRKRFLLWILPNDWLASRHTWTYHQNSEVENCQQILNMVYSCSKQGEYKYCGQLFSSFSGRMFRYVCLPVGGSQRSNLFPWVLEVWGTPLWIARWCSSSVGLLRFGRCLPKIFGLRQFGFRAVRLVIITPLEIGRRRHHS